MIRIGICDDNRMYLEQLKNIIYGYANRKEIEVEVYTYINGQEMWKRISECENYFDIVFLDIDMPYLDGITLAQKIRGSNNTVLIVFLTHLEEKVYETFRYNTFRFIRKNNLKEEINECLESAFLTLEQDSKLYTFKLKDGFVKLKLQDILYFNYLSRRVEIHTLKTEYVIHNVRFQDVIDKFQEKDFVLIHRACLVNVRYIRYIHKLYVELDTDEKLTMSRYRVNDVFEAFTHYAEKGVI